MWRERVLIGSLGETPNRTIFCRDFGVLSSSPIVVQNVQNFTACQLLTYFENKATKIWTHIFWNNSTLFKKWSFSTYCPLLAASSCCQEQELWMETQVVWTQYLAVSCPTDASVHLGPVLNVNSSDLWQDIRLSAGGEAVAGWRRFGLNRLRSLDSYTKRTYVAYFLKIRFRQRCKRSGRSERSCGLRGSFGFFHLYWAPSDTSWLPFSILYRYWKGEVHWTGQRQSG